MIIENLGVYHESRPQTPNLGVSDRVRLHVVFVCTVHSATSAVLAVVGDGRSGDPLHERGDKRDVYEGEVAKVDSVSELVRRVDGVVDGLRSLVDVARGSVNIQIVFAVCSPSQTPSIIHTKIDTIVYS